MSGVFAHLDLNIVYSFKPPKYTLKAAERDN